MNGSNTFESRQTNDSDSFVNIAELFYKLLDKALLIILAAVVGAAGMGLAFGTSSDTTYSSTSKLYLISSEEEAISISDIQAMYYLVYDYLEVFRTNELHRRVGEEANVAYTPSQLSEMVAAENIEETPIIGITVKAKTAEEAELLANTYAEVTGSLVEEKFGVPKPRLFERATPAVKAVSSDAKRNIILGAMGGLFVSCIAIVLYAVFDDRVYTPEDLRNAAGIDTLGVLTRQKKTKTAKRRSP